LYPRQAALWRKDKIFPESLLKTKSYSYICYIVTVSTENDSQVK
jgi:hypothetical protein